MEENLNKIRNIEDKYGPLRFRLGLTLLVEVGHRHLTDEHVSKSIQQIMIQDEEDKANGKVSVMTAEYEYPCELVRCAGELSHFSIWTLFAYIKKYVEVSNENER